MIIRALLLLSALWSPPPPPPPQAQTFSAVWLSPAGYPGRDAVSTKRLLPAQVCPQECRRVSVGLSDAITAPDGAARVQIVSPTRPVALSSDGKRWQGIQLGRSSRKGEVERGWLTGRRPAVSLQPMLLGGWIPFSSTIAMAKLQAQ